MNKRSGFTLTELLTVISVIALLVMILVPSVNRGRELGRRTNCSANLKAIGAGVLQYVQTVGSNACLPAIAEANSNNSTVGLNRTDLTKPSNGITRAWFMLPLNELVPLATFACPSNSAQMNMNYDRTGIYDFATVDGSQPISYAFQVTKINTSPTPGFTLNLTDPSSIPIGADQNGRCKWTTLTAGSAVVDLDNSTTDTSNSPNHGREGQNVLVLGGGVSWKTTPKCGLPDASGQPDDIWTSKGGSILNGVPSDHSDSYLMP
jgi:prepilin-type N-terminal cleavage/methylation domain-containing protein